MTACVLIAGIGNIFLGDDAFGVELARRLEGRLPAAARLVDFGIRGFDLAYALLGEYEAAVLLDAVRRGDPPGTLSLIEIDPDNVGGAGLPALETHNIDPVKVLALVRALGGRPGRLLLVGCEAASFGEEQEGRMGLSPEVEAALAPAAAMVSALVGDLLGEPVGSRQSQVKEVRS